jgi:glycosyltransferase involved in cell wall biosynthesis
MPQKEAEQLRSMLVIGAYSSSYPRNQVLIRALGEVFEIQEINVAGKKFSNLLFIYSLIRFGRKKDFIFVIQPIYKLAFWLWFYKIITGKKIIIDAFISTYDSFISDRKLARRFSLKALYYYCLDAVSCLVADYIIFDTQSNQDYFKKKYFIHSKTHALILPLAIDLSYYDSMKYERDYAIFPKDKFNVFFYGNFIPLQGVEYIVKAAALLKNISEINFILLGSGQTRKESESLASELGLKNIIFLNRVPFSDLVKYIKMSDACLGIFGGTDKAKRVIPNKVLDYLACEKITITGRNSEMEKYFKDGEDLFYVNMADEKDLAEKIKYIYEQLSNLGAISKKGKDKIKDNFNPNKFLEIIKSEIK